MPVKSGGAAVYLTQRPKLFLSSPSPPQNQNAAVSLRKKMKKSPEKT